MYKGKQKGEVVITTSPFGDDDSMGYPFLCGETYHVNARKESKSKVLYTDQCMRIKPLSSNAMDPGDLEDILLNPESKASKEEKDKLWKRMLCPASP